MLSPPFGGYFAYVEESLPLAPLLPGATYARVILYKKIENFSFDFIIDCVFITDLEDDVIGIGCRRLVNTGRFQLQYCSIQLEISNLVVVI